MPELIGMNLQVVNYFEIGSSESRCTTVHSLATTSIVEALRSLPLEEVDSHSRRMVKWCSLSQFLSFGFESGNFLGINLLKNRFEEGTTRFPNLHLTTDNALGKGYDADFFDMAILDGGQGS